MGTAFLSARRIHLALLGIIFYCGAFFFTPAAGAEQKTFEFDPAQTKVTFTLGDVLHTVHGTFRLKRGSIHFDDSTGQATGELVVDATSGDSGSHARDGKMHKEILESQKYPEIIFTPQSFKGSLARTGKSHLDVAGQFMIHGQAHPITLTVDADLSGGADAAADTAFDVPYQQWGMKNPSTFILRVDDKVQISIHAVARQLTASQPQAAAPPPSAPATQASSH